MATRGTLCRVFKKFTLVTVTIEPGDYRLVDVETESYKNTSPITGKHRLGQNLVDASGKVLLFLTVEALTKLMDENLELPDS